MHGMRKARAFLQKLSEEDDVHHVRQPCPSAKSIHTTFPFSDTIGSKEKGIAIETFCEYNNLILSPIDQLSLKRGHENIFSP